MAAMIGSWSFSNKIMHNKRRYVNYLEKKFAD